MDLEGIIREQRGELEEIAGRGRLVARKGTEDARRFLAVPNILAVLGVRRCGKSVFSHQLAVGRSFGYVNFDDERLAEITTADLDKILQAFYSLYGDVEYVVLDEIQNVPGWELFANRLRRTKKVIITGSNSTLLSGELSTKLTGRHITFRLFPFSFREFLEYNGFSLQKAYTAQEKARIRNLLEEYLHKGGFPEGYALGDAILRRTYEDIVTKDVAGHFKVKKREDLRRLAHYLVSNSGCETTYSKLSKIFAAKHVSTVSNWIAFLESAFLVFKLERFSYKLKEQVLAPKKIYCIDTGLARSVAFNFSKNAGRAAENAVAVELLRRKKKGGEIYYWKDHQQNEVDFVAKEGRKVAQLIQVTMEPPSFGMPGREAKALLKAGKELKCGNLLVITRDTEEEKTAENRAIKYVPLWKWLLEDAP